MSSERGSQRDDRALMRQASSVLVPERRRRLLDQVLHYGAASVDHLAGQLGVSASTVRRDLSVLEAQGVLRRARGGAFVEPVERGFARPEPSAVKARIGQAAAALVTDGMTAMILAGSTTTAMLPHLADRTVTVITNGLDVAHTLADYPGVTLVVLGGVLHRDQRTMLGPLSERAMADLHADVLFAGAWGVHPEVGVTGAKVVQAGYHHTVLRHVQSLVVLADATKLDRRGPTLLARTEQVDTVVTDHDAPPAALQGLRERGVTVTLC